ncbi:hypothetical protein VTG60DRAFT_1370 [Thermothelomyces hinnuleus]
MQRLITDKLGILRRRGACQRRHLQERRSKRASHSDTNEKCPKFGVAEGFVFRVCMWLWVVVGKVCSNAPSPCGRPETFFLVPTGQPKVVNPRDVPRVINPGDRAMCVAAPERGPVGMPYPRQGECNADEGRTPSGSIGRRAGESSSRSPTQ